MAHILVLLVSNHLRIYGFSNVGQLMLKSGTLCFGLEIITFLQSKLHI